MTTDNDKKYQDKYPECSKIAAHHDNLMTLRTFIHWLGEKKGYDISDILDPNKIIEPHEDLFAEFYDIDNKKAEIERQQMIQELQDAK